MPLMDDPIDDELQRRKLTPMVAPPPGAGLPAVGQPIGTAPVQKDSAELARLKSTGSGIDQFQGNHHIAGGFLKGLDMLASSFVPGVAQNIPGTTAHHDLLVNKSQNAVNDDVTNNARKAQAAHADAETEKILHPPKQEPNTAFELWHQQNPTGTLEDYNKAEAVGKDKGITSEFQLWRKDNQAGTAEDYAKFQAGHKNEAKHTAEDIRSAIADAYEQGNPAEVARLQKKLKAVGDPNAAERLQITLQNANPFGSASIPKGVHGEDALALMDPHAAASVKLVGDGKVDLQTMTSRMQPQAKNTFIQLVDAYNPEYSQGTFGVKKSTMLDAATGDIAKSSRSFNTAIAHLGTLDKAIEALGNGNMQALNSFGNTYSTQTGNAAPTNFDTVKNAVSAEIAKAFAGGGVTEGDRKNIEAALNSSMSPQQLRGAVKQSLELLHGKMDALQYQRDNGLAGGTGDLISPEAKAALGGKSPSHIVKDSQGKRIGTVVNGEYVPDKK